MEQIIRSLEKRVNKIEEKVEKQGLEVAETRVYVQEIYKNLEELKTNLLLLSNEKAKYKDKYDDRMSKIIERTIWAIVTIIGYFLGKGGV